MYGVPTRTGDLHAVRQSRLMGNSELGWGRRGGFRRDGRQSTGQFRKQELAFTYQPETGHGAKADGQALLAPLTKPTSYSL